MKKIIGIGIAASLAVLCCMGNKSCSNPSTGTGSLIVVGNVPVSVAHPMGVSVRGRSAGLNVWMLASATASAAALAAAETRAQHLVGGTVNELASSPKDPCQDKSLSVRVGGWKEKGIPVFIDCKQWRILNRHSASQFSRMTNPVKKILKCLENSIQHAIITAFPGVGNVFKWTYGSGMETFISAEKDGRIYAVSSTNWEVCANS